MDDFVIVAFDPIQREQLGLEGEINAHAEFEANVYACDRKCVGDAS